MKSRVLLTFVLSLGLFLALGNSLVFLSAGVLAQEFHQNESSPISVTPPVTLTVRLLEAEDTHPDEGDEAANRISDSDRHPLISPLATNVSGNVSGTWNVSW